MTEKNESCGKIVLLGLFNEYSSIKNKNIILKNIINFVGITINEIELGAGYLYLKEYIYANKISIKEEVTITELGLNKATNIITNAKDNINYALMCEKQALERSKKEQEKEDLELNNIMKETHFWGQIQGSYGGNGAEAFLRTKYYPMGGYCKKCGITSNKFKAMPSFCPKK